MPDPMQKIQLEEFLRQADKCIREGRYLAADELIQKALKLQPDSTAARVHQDRMLFLINQLSHRLGVAPETQAEIRKFRELQRTRQANQVNGLLLEARRSIDNGHFDRANEALTKAVALDAENEYAKALVHRLTELRGHHGRGGATEQQFQFRSLLRESWVNGVPAEEQQKIIAAKREQLSLSTDQAAAIELEVRGERYSEALKELWADGGLVGFTDETIARLMARFGVNRMEHARAETHLLKSVRTNRILGNVLVALGDRALLGEVVYKLRLKSFSVIAALDAEEALASLAIARPGVILSSLEFPGGASGFDLYQAIRTRKESPAIPFMFVGPALDRTTLLIGKRLGVDDFVALPIDYEMLFATLQGKLSGLRKGAQA